MANINVEYKINVTEGKTGRKELSAKEKEVRALKKELRALRKRSKLDRQIERLNKKIAKFKPIDEVEVEGVKITIDDNDNN